MYFEIYKRNNKEPSQKSWCITERVLCYMFQERNLVYKIWHYEKKTITNKMNALWLLCFKNDELENKDSAKLSPLIEEHNGY